MASRSIELSRQSRKFLDTLVEKHRQQILQRLADLRDKPRPHDSEHLKGKFKGYRVDCGEYRIVYTFDNDTIAVVLVDKRNDGRVYKKLRNK